MSLATWFETVTQDLRHAGRQLLRSPGFTLIASCSLALGIGATTTIFSVVHAVVIDPFAYKDPKTLMSVEVLDANGRGNWSTYTTDEYLEIADRARTFDGVIASTISDVAMTGMGDPERLRGNVVSMNTFDVMGVPPLLGRTLTADDARPGAAPVTILGYRFWQRRFGGREDILGETLRLNGVARTVVGVMPRRFMWRGADVYLPTLFERGRAVEGARTVHVMGRLKPGLTREQAAAELRPVIEELQRRDPERIPARFRIRLRSFDETFASGLRQALLILLGAVGVLLLIACVNVSNLLLARNSVREREIAMRASLGAGRARLVRQLFTESAIIAVLGAVLGILVAWASLAAVLSIVPPNTIPDESHVRLNLPVLFFAIAVAIASCIVFGLLPAWQTSRADVMALLREGGRGTAGARQARMRRILVTTEVALAVVLLIGAALMMRTLVRMQQVDVSFDPSRILAMRVPLSETRYPTPERRAQFFRALLERVEGLPGVLDVAISSGGPLIGARGTRIEVPGRGEPDPRFVMVHETTPRYLRLVQGRIVSGRYLEQADADAVRHVAVVNETFARRYFGTESPIGRTVKLLYLAAPPIRATDASFEIVGLMRDYQNQAVQDQPMPEVHVPYSVNANNIALLVRTATPPLQLERSVRQQVTAVDPEQPVTDVGTVMSFLNDRVYSSPRFNLVLLGVFSTLGLLLAAIGVYGVMSYAVSRQTQEIGVRMALGAGRADILRLVLRRGLTLIGLGLGFGLVTALFATRVLASQLHGLSRFDPLSFGAVALLILLVGVAACLWPAIGAARTPPMRALRAD
jgi:putative ABC transport system permease protein